MVEKNAELDATMLQFVNKFTFLYTYFVSLHFEVENTAVSIYQYLKKVLRLKNV